MEVARATIAVERIELRVNEVAVTAILATVSNAQLAHYYVPDGGKQSVGWDRERLKEDIPKFVERSGASPEWKAYLRDYLTLGEPKALPARTIPTSAIEQNRTRLVPLLTLKGWFEFFKARRKEIPLMVNANWFSIQGPGGHPHAVPFTYLMGLSVKKGKTVSAFDARTEHGNALDALVVFEHGHARELAILENDRIGAELGRIQFAVAGFSILKAGEYIDRGNMKSANAGEKKRRTAAGISKDGTRLHLIVVETEITLATLGKLLQELGDFDAINLDNSGSSQMVWNGVEQTAPADTVGHFGLGSDKRYRPIPNFFAVGDQPIKKAK